MKKANGPKKKKKKLITHLMTMPQAAGKNILHWWYVAKLEVTNISFLFWKVTP